MLGWLDPVSAGSLLAAAAALIVAVRGNRSSTKTDNRNVEHREIVDADVLAQFLSLTNRVGDVEKDLTATKTELAETREQLAAALVKLEEMQKLEEYLRASLHDKDKQIEELKQAGLDKTGEIERLRSRVQHLEEVCKRAGINGDNDCDDEEATK